MVACKEGASFYQIKLDRDLAGDGNENEGDDEDKRRATGSIQGMDRAGPKQKTKGRGLEVLIFVSGHVDTVTCMGRTSACVRESERACACPYV